MIKIEKYNNVIQRFLQSRKGKIFFNVAYCVGAAIVLWGALFHILHIKGGSTLLCIGMGTEILMFLLSAFEPPSDSVENNDHKQSHLPEDEKQDTVVKRHPAVSLQPEKVAVQSPALEIPGSGSPVIDADGLSGEFRSRMDEVLAQMSALSKNIAGLNTIYEIQLRSISGQLETIQSVNDSMKDIRDMFDKSSGESIRYQQEAEKMTRHMQHINAVYEKMLKALTVNMPGASANNDPFASGNKE